MLHMYQLAEQVCVCVCACVQLHSCGAMSEE